MTSSEIVKALRYCSTQDCFDCAACKYFGYGDCLERLVACAADLIERLEKEKAALIEATNPRKLCEICKNDSYCSDARCDGNRCDDCSQYRGCPCADCLSHPKWEWKELEDEK